MTLLVVLSHAISQTAMKCSSNHILLIAVSRTKATGTMGQFMSKMNKSPAKWINELSWKECFQLSSSIFAFSGLCSDIALNGGFWSRFSSSENPFKFLEDGDKDAGDSHAGINSMTSKIILPLKKVIQRIAR